jgi:Arc/MetJ-type ribon-helix-helix transcriptional regulator
MLKQIVEPKVTTSVALPVEQHRALAEAAHRQRKSQGEVVREALNAWLGQEKHDAR